MLAQACEERRSQAGDDHKVDTMEEQNHFRGIGEKVTTSVNELRVLGGFGGHDVPYAPNITDNSTLFLVGK